MNATAEVSSSDDVTGGAEAHRTASTGRRRTGGTHARGGPRERATGDALRGLRTVAGGTWAAVRLVRATTKESERE